MPFRLLHTVLDDGILPIEHVTDQGTYFTVEYETAFAVDHPGRFDRFIEASLMHMRPDPPSPTGEVHEPPVGIDQSPSRFPSHPESPKPPGKGFDGARETIPLRVAILDPDGARFDAAEVTEADLDRYRDLRGLLTRPWRCVVQGTSATYVLDEVTGESVGEPAGFVRLEILETLPSQSAPPLLSDAEITLQTQEFAIDLHREGLFVAEIQGDFNGSMVLRDPDGAMVGRTAGSRLEVDIPLRLLGTSRDAAGNPRLWTLAFRPSGGVMVGAARVSATVIRRGRIRTATLLDRIAHLIGEHGQYLKFSGVNTADHIEIRLTITDPEAAEAFEMWKLLKAPMKKTGYKSFDIEAGTPITVYRTSRGNRVRLDASDVSLASIDVSIGSGTLLSADAMVVRLKLGTGGPASGIKVALKGSNVADAHLRDGLTIEVGLHLDDEGVPRLAVAISEDPIDITSLLFIGELVEELAEYFGQPLLDGLNDLLKESDLAVRILMTIFGGHFTYRRIFFEGDEIVFEYDAPLEPDRRPRDNWKAAIGRSWTLEPGGVRFELHGLGNSWKADKLKEHIDHIVVVMMENRSYDHVLGYRSRARAEGPVDGVIDGADGLTDAVIAAVQGTPEGYTVRPLRNAQFPLNAAGKRTRIPYGVGHEVEDVAQQLSGRIQISGGRELNDPKGFVDNFRKKTKLEDDPGSRQNPTLPQDVLGYYDDHDLPIYGHLAKHYSYADRYFCSHPGPTMPNRMYLLTGDVDHDRHGGPIIHNFDDTFMLSRDETIFDVLEKHGVSWRVYESFPSVATLRMFARYATDNEHIRPLDQLEADVASGNLPAFVSVEPAMHHSPQDDDHPDADMWRGQQFIHRVYKALRSNPDTWAKTLLIITYDEHGGLYDHVVPPAAEVVFSQRIGEVEVGEDGASGGASGGPIVGGAMSDGSQNAGSGGQPAPGEPSTGNSPGAPGTVHLAGWGHKVTMDHPDVTDMQGAPAAAPPPPSELVIPYGLRVPTFVVSPWVQPGKGPSIVLDHCSIIKTVLARFVDGERPFLSERVAGSLTFEEFLTAPEARDDIPLPDRPQDIPIEDDVAPATSGTEIVTPLFSVSRLRDHELDYHDMSGWMARTVLGR